MNARYSVAVMAAILAAGASNVSLAQATFTEDFRGATTSNNWYFFNGACLTAGTVSGSASPGKIPSCTSIQNSYYAQQQDHDTALVGGKNGVAGNAQTLPDPAQGGALRFTNGSPFGHDENGAIVSATAFNAGQGIQITFKTVTYRGDSGGNGKDGADGMSFYLINGAESPTDGIWNGIGSWGGSLGYTCSNSNPPYNGLVGAYLGLGIDEFGNFLNGATLVPGYTGTNTASGDNTALGYGYFPGRIGLRGAGNVSWAYLNYTYPSYYPTSLSVAQQQAAVQKTCSTGMVWNYSASATNPTQVTNPTPALQDYAPIVAGTNPAIVPYSELPSSIQLANEAAMARPDGTTTNGVTNGNVFLYNLQITQNGLLSFSYSVNGGAYTPVITSQSITASNGALPATLRFGFAGSTGGDTNIHEILCFKAAPSTVSASSAAVNEKQTSQVNTTSQAYFSFYNPNDWTGRVTAYGLVDSGGTVSINSLANWDSECVLSGVLAGQFCTYTNVPGPTAAEPISGSGGRQILTLNGLDTTAAAGIKGIPFEWASLTSAEQTVLDAGDATMTANRLNYLRGDRTNEINMAGAGTFRARDGVMADVVDSSPTWVGPPQSPYILPWRDRFVTTDPIAENLSNGQSSYSAFQTSNQGRLNVIYAGANDGFLHGFRTGSQNAAGLMVTSSSTPNDGSEVLAYMPGAVLNTIHSTTPSLDYANPQYAHNFFVDGPPGGGDLYYGGAWHTWLMGGLGAGGSAVYALDVTNPSSFAEGNAASQVIGEWGAATITCVGNSTCGKSLGNTYGTPQIRRFHNGSWGAVFGNGYGSVNGDAGIFIMLVGSPSGSAPPPVTFYYLSAGTSPGNGIAYVTPADLDGDHITDFVYAGDLKGNVWRFDLTSATPSQWAVTSPGPLFTATGPTGLAQPITTPVVVASAIVAGTQPNVIVAFGTGQRTQFTNSSATSYVTNTQSIYGVWDWNFSTPNPGSTVSWNSKAVAQYSSLTSTGSTSQIHGASGLSAPYTLSRANLTKQTYTVVQGNPVTVTATNNSVGWVNCASSCAAGSFGWYVDLPGSNGTTTTNGTPIIEQIVSSPAVFEDALIVNSTIPANNQPLNCNSPTTDGGVTYAVAMVSGGVFAQGGASPTSTTTSFSSAFVNYKDTMVAGIQNNETGALSVVNTKESTTYLIGQDISVTAGQAPGHADAVALSNTTVNRLTWVELR
jgi:type IV pilus assembly protein PilY1